MYCYNAVDKKTIISQIIASSLIDKHECRLLIAHYLQLTQAQLVTAQNKNVSEEQYAQIQWLIQKRAAGEPIAYLLGEREFYSLSFKVTPAVLIPRPDTELLVDLILQHVPPNAHVLELGTGSGAISISVAKHRPDLKIIATDISEAALVIAQENAKQHQCENIAWRKSDWFSAFLENESFDLIVSNPPYIASSDVHLKQGDLRFEPIYALTDHADGLSAIQKIITGATKYLNRAGYLFLEHGYQQAAAVRQLLLAQQFSDVASHCDLAGIERVTVGLFMGTAN